MGTLDNNNNRSFRHLIGEAGGRYFDKRHFLGMNPFDHTIFRDKYENKKAGEKPKLQKT